VQEMILAEEQARSLQPSDEQDLSMKPEETRECVDGIESECATEAKQLSQLGVCYLSRTFPNSQSQLKRS
jgi:hypothetical protein